MWSESLLIFISPIMAHSGRATLQKDRFNLDYTMVSLRISMSPVPPPPQHLPRPHEHCSCGRGFFVPMLMGLLFRGSSPIFIGGVQGLFIGGGELALEEASDLYRFVYHSI